MWSSVIVNLAYKVLEMKSVTLLLTFADWNFWICKSVTLLLLTFADWNFWICKSVTLLLLTFADWNFWICRQKISKAKLKDLTNHSNSYC